MKIIKSRGRTGCSATCRFPPNASQKTILVYVSLILCEKESGAKIACFQTNKQKKKRINTNSDARKLQALFFALQTETFSLTKTQTESHKITENLVIILIEVTVKHFLSLQHSATFKWKPNDS